MVNNSVLYNVDQRNDTTATQKATARDNIGAQQKLTAGENITLEGNTISATDTKYAAGEGLTLNGNTFAADAHEIRPWAYFNHYAMSENWTSKVDRGTCILDAADIASGIIKIPFDNVHWPLTTSAVQYCLCCFNAIRIYKARAMSSLAGQVWKGTFEYATTRVSDRYDYNNCNICDFSWTWNSEGSFTDYAGGWAFIMDMNPRETDSFKNLVFDFRDYKQYLEEGDELRIGGHVWPLSLKVFNYTY